MSIIQLVGAIEIGLIYGIVALGVYISLRILDFPDLGVDGSFPLGAAICSVLITNEINPLIATSMTLVVGAMTGLVTAWLSTHLRFMNLLSGILVMTGLYSINLKIMGKPNISLLGDKTIFSYFDVNILGFNCGKILTLGIFLAVILIATDLFLKTNLGLALRATGNNACMARAQGINDKTMIAIGLAISNAFVAFGGALLCQLNGYSDITMGVGTIIIGLAAVIIGEAILPSRKIFIILIACGVGAILYRLLIAASLNLGSSFLQASDLNLVTAVLVGLAMLLPDLKRKISKQQ